MTVRGQFDVRESGNKTLGRSDTSWRRGAGGWKKAFRGSINESEVGRLTRKTEPMMLLRF